MQQLHNPHTTEHMDLSQCRVAVIGAGTMGIGIAQLAAMHGHPTLVFDLNANTAVASMAQLTERLSKRVAAGKMSQQQLDDTLGNMQVVTEIQQLAAAGLIIEAVVEKKEVKQSLFQQLAEICPEQTILASNTSSISITAIASAVPQPERVVGLHFFNPAPVMKLVEIVKGLKTSPAIADALFSLMQAWQKVPVMAKSTPGFIVNRVARPYYAEGFRALQENVTTPQQLDYILRESGGFAMGPCELTDLIGQDVNFSVTQSVYQEFFYEPRYRPSLIQKELVDAGCYGRKNKQGFYHYDTDQRTPIYTRPNLSVELNAALKNQDFSQLNVQFCGDWGNCVGLSQRLDSVVGLQIQHLQQPQASKPEILIDDLSLSLSQGQSVLIDHAQAKVMLMDWHADWHNAQAVVITASPACTAADCDKVTLLFAACGISIIWSKDHPGLFVLRSIAMLVNEACEAVLHGIATEQDIDAAMKYGVNYPQGPFQWAAQMGYAHILTSLDNLYRLYGEERYRPSLLLRQKAALAAQTTQHNVLNNAR